MSATIPIETGRLFRSMPAGVASARWRYNLFMVRVFGPGRYTRRGRGVARLTCGSISEVHVSRSDYRWFRSGPAFSRQTATGTPSRTGSGSDQAMLALALRVALTSRFIGAILDGLDRSQRRSHDKC
jgi:hypothetical protein